MSDDTSFITDHYLYDEESYFFQFILKTWNYKNVILIISYYGHINAKMKQDKNERRKKQHKTFHKTHSDVIEGEQTNGSYIFSSLRCKNVHFYRKNIYCSWKFSFDLIKKVCSTH